MKIIKQTRFKITLLSLLLIVLLIILNFFKDFDLKTIVIAIEIITVGYTTNRTIQKFTGGRND